MSNIQYYTPGVMQSTNFKEYFLQYDALENVACQLIFSVLRRYKCNAGCKMCYLREKWMSDEQYAAYGDDFMSEQTEAQILKFFESFSVVTSIDDLNLLKKEYPTLFQFYVRNSAQMISSSLSDTAFIQQYDILVNELNFKETYEITFSDVFLNKKQGMFVHDLIAKLNVLHVKSPIRKMKVIICTADGDESEPVQALVDWAHSVNVSVGLHDDFTLNKNRTLSLKIADYQEQNTLALDSIPRMVLSEVVYLHHSSCFLTLLDATENVIDPYFDIVDDNIDDMGTFLARTLQEKIKIYDRYVKATASTCGNKLYDYFGYVTGSVTVNVDFTFIPRIVVKPWTEIYKTLIAQGFVETPHGLIKPTPTNAVVPLFTISAKPKQKIYHIPIKFVPITKAY